MNSKMNLVIDAGNTRLKVGIFLEASLKEKKSFDSSDALKLFLQKNFFNNLLISSVGMSADEIASWATVSGQKIILTPSLPLPIKNQYSTPETLGVDRIAAVCGALDIFPDRNCLIIDAGTCITYELLDHNANYWGGAISPGIEMRLKAMNTFTARLPLVQIKADADLMGNNTERCLQSGAWNGVIAEVEGIIARYEKKYPELVVILCGGSASLFENRLKPTIFVAPDLVLSGLNRILRHNAL